jgi:hypothetical protein
MWELVEGVVVPITAPLSNGEQCREQSGVYERHPLSLAPERGWHSEARSHRESASVQACRGFCKQQVVSSSLSTGSSTRAGIQPALSFCENVQLLA